MKNEKKKILNNSFKENLFSKKLSPDKKGIIQLFFIYLWFQLDVIISIKTSYFIISKYSYIRLKINGTGRAHFLVVIIILINQMKFILIIQIKVL